MQFLADQMHGMRRAGGHNCVYRVFLQVFLQGFHGRLHPAHAGVRHKEVGADPQAQALFPGLFSGRYLRDLRALSAQQFPIGGIGLPDAAPKDFHICGNLGLEGRIQGRVIGIQRSEDNRLPTFLGQILHELHPPLHARSPGRRPVVRYDQYAFHKRTKLIKNHDYGEGM